MKKLIVLLALAFVACGPSEQEFKGACLAKCLHSVACGLVVPPPFTGCDNFCATEWVNVEGQSSDCVWFAVYWYDCQAEASCDALWGENCVGQLGDVSAACDF